MKNQRALDQHRVSHIERTGVEVVMLEKFMQQDADNIIGRKMTAVTKNLAEAQHAYAEASKSLLSSSDALHAQMDGLSKRAKESVSRAKDMAAQMTDAMNRVSKLVGPDFERRLEQLERLTECLERLSDLNAAGKLAPMLSALDTGSSRTAVR